MDESNVCENAFELVFAFDEVIACGAGLRDSVSMRDVQVGSTARLIIHRRDEPLPGRA